MPQNYVLPAILYFKVTNNPVNTVSGTGTKENSRIQIDCYAGSYSEVKAISVQVRAGMAAATSYKSLVLSEQDLDFETALDVYRVTLDFSVWL